MSSWSPNSAKAQPEGYFMLRESLGEVTDQLQKSITVTLFPLSAS
ncbi:hypothetical protein ACMYSM_18540 [Raoultella planticola]